MNYRVGEIWKQPHLLWLSLVVNSLFVGAALYNHSTLIPLFSQQPESNANDEAPDSGPVAPPKKMHVAVVAPTQCKAIDKIIGGARDYLDQSNDYTYDFSIFYGEGNRTLLRSGIEAISLGNYDIVFTIGVHCSVMAHEIIKKKYETLPIVFSAINDPVYYGLVDNLERPGGNVTGSAAEFESRHLEQMDRFFALKPRVEKLVIPYNPVYKEAMDTDLKRLTHYASLKGIPTQLVEVYQTNEVASKLAGYVDKNTLVLILRDASVIAATEAIAKICRMNGGILFTSDLEGIKNGAAFSFGAQESMIGVESAKKIKLILEQGTSPGDIPITIPDFEYKLLVNLQALKDQDVEVDPLMLFLVQHAEVVTS